MFMLIVDKTQSHIQNGNDLKLEMIQGLFCIDVTFQSNANAILLCPEANEQFI